MSARQPDDSGPFDPTQPGHWRILDLMRRAERYFPDFWPPWQVASWEEEEEREEEMHNVIERSYWEEDD